MRDGEPVSVPIDSVLCSNSGDVLRAAALSGRGVAFLPTFLVGRDIESGGLRTVLDRFPQPALGVHALYASNRYLAAKTRAFVDFLAGRFGDEPEWDRFRRLSAEPARRDAALARLCADANLRLEMRRVGCLHSGRPERATAIDKEGAMIRMTFAALAIAASAGVALAAATGADAIKERRDLMKADGAATKPVVAMLQGKAPFDLATVQKALKTYQNAASKESALFPPDSKTGDTNALPVIWEDDNMADLQARFKKFGEDATAALASIKDEASFKATMPGVLKNCGGCHEKYQAKQQYGQAPRRLERR